MIRSRLLPPIAPALAGFVRGVRGDAGLYAVIGAYVAVVAAFAAAHGRSYTGWLVAKYVAGWTSTALACAVLYAAAWFVLLLVRERPHSPVARFRQVINEVLKPAHAAGLVLYVALAGFMGAFTAIKTLLPELQPFWADRLLSDMGTAIAFGRPTWRLLQPFVGYPPVTRLIEVCYVPVWTGLLILGPFALAVSASRPLLRRQALWAFVLAWIINGTVLAAMFMSAGPAFYAQLTGDAARYGPLLQYLGHVGGEPYSARVLQGYLWEAYKAQGRDLGAGISAFPSMHATMAVLWALVARRIDWRAGAAMAVFAGVIVVGSIHLGWHYALDSYFAVPSTILIWRLAGRIARGERELGPAPAIAAAAAPAG